MKSANFHRIFCPATRLRLSLLSTYHSVITLAKSGAEVQDNELTQQGEEQVAATTMTTDAPKEKPSSRSRGTFLCTAVVYVLLVSFVCAFFFMEQNPSSSNGDPDDDNSSASNGLQRVFNMAQSHFGNKPEPADEETAIAEAKEQQQEREHPYSILSNDEDSDWPHWLKKYAFMPTPDEVGDADRICYVHVGKTAGSTMACELGFAYQGKETKTRMQNAHVIFTCWLPFAS